MYVCMYVQYVNIDMMARMLDLGLAYCECM